MLDINKNKKDDIKEVEKRIFEIIQIGTRVDFWSRAFDYFITVVILLNIIVTFLHTFEVFSKYVPLFHSIELITTIIFIIEYALRLITSNQLFPKDKQAKSLLKFIFSFYGIVDLLAIISYFSIIFTNGFVALKMIRVVRILRLFQVNTQSDAFNVVSEVITDKKNQILSSLFMVFVLLLAASLCMYGLEHDAQPDAFSNAFAGIWWAMSTVLTVGYGDIYPITIGGKIVAILIAVLGVGIVAIPTGIVSAGFVEHYTKFKLSSKQISFKKDIRDMLDEQADAAGLSAEDYLERMILEKNWEKNT